MEQTSPPRRLRWVSWAAVSSAPQATPDKISIPYQQEQNRAACAKHGGELVAELVVPGESRSIDTWEEACERIDAYAQLRTLLAARAFDVLVYYDASRLARTLSLGATIRQLCARRGVALYPTTTPPAELSARWRVDRAMSDAMLGIFAQDEVARLAERRRVGMLGRVQRGLMPGRIPYGYRKVFDLTGAAHIEVVPDEAAAVLLAVRRYLDGDGSDRVAAALNAAGIQSPSGRTPWSPSGVIQILDRIWVYAGYTEYNRRSRQGDARIRRPAAWAPILDEQTVRQVESERAQRRANRKLPSGPHRLAGIGVCAECGGSMWIEVVSAYYKGKRRAWTYMACRRHKPRIAVNGAQVLAALAAAMDALRETDLEAAAASMPDPLAALYADISTQERTAAQLAQALERADYAFTHGLMDADRYSTQVNKLRSDGARAQAELARLGVEVADAQAQGPRVLRLQDARDNGRAWLTTPDDKAANVWLRAHVRVICTQKQVVAVEFL